MESSSCFLCGFCCTGRCGVDFLVPEAATDDLFSFCSHYVWREKRCLLTGVVCPLPAAVAGGSPNTQEVLTHARAAFFPLDSTVILTDQALDDAEARRALYKKEKELEAILDSGDAGRAWPVASPMSGPAAYRGRGEMGVWEKNLLLIIVNSLRSVKILGGGEEWMWAAVSDGAGVEWGRCGRSGMRGRLSCLCVRIFYFVGWSRLARVASTIYGATRAV